MWPLQYGFFADNKRGPAPIPFSPADLTGLVGWYKSDTGVLDSSDVPCVNNGNVKTWQDQSGNSHHLVQATASKQPAYFTNTVNGYADVEPDGVNDFLKASFTLVQPWTIFVVMTRITDQAGTIVYWEGATDNTGEGYQNAGSLGKATLYAGTDGPTSAAGTVPKYSGGVGYVILCGVYNGASSRLRKNADTASTGDVGTGNPGGLVLGGLSQALLDFANIGVAEIIIYNSALSTGDESKVRGYLNTRYALF